MNSQLLKKQILTAVSISWWKCLKNTAVRLKRRFPELNNLTKIFAAVLDRIEKNNIMESDSLTADYHNVFGGTL